MRFRRMMFFLLVSGVVTACGAPLLGQNEQPATTDIAQATNPPDPSPEWTPTTPPLPRAPTVTPSRETVSTATPKTTQTPMVDAELAQLLTTDYRLDCEYSGEPQCGTALAVQLLDYLYRNPNTLLQTAVLDRIAWIGRGGDQREAHAGFSTSDFLWVLDAWVDARIRQPVVAADGVPARLVAEWRDLGGDIIATDLDADGTADYLITAFFARGYSEPNGGNVYWLHQQDNTWLMEAISMLNTYGYGEHTVQPEIKSLQDLNGDGQQDIATQTTSCGASTCFYHLCVITRAGDGWRSLLMGEEVTGGWEISQKPDGATLIRASHNGSGSSGTSAPMHYTVEYEWLNGEFLPMALSTDHVFEFTKWDMGRLDNLDYLMWADLLQYSGRLTEATTLLSEFTTPLPVEPTHFAYQPVALFRLGMLQSAQNNPVGADVAWHTIEQRFPDNTITADIALLRPLLQTANAVWTICDQLNHANTWVFDTGDPRSDSLLDWRTQCNSRWLVPARAWSTDQTIAAQMQQLGVTWTDLDLGYDLNGDGSADPIGVLDWAGRRAPWAFLSAGDQYQPLYVAQTLPLGTIDHKADEEYYTIKPNQQIELRDLDNNSTPEIIISQEAISQPDSALYGLHSGAGVWSWRTDRFSSAYANYNLSIYGKQPLYGSLTFEPQADSTVLLRADLVASETPNAPPFQWRYRFADDVLTRIEPPVTQTSDLATVIAVLFRDRDPDQALALLELMEPLRTAAELRQQQDNDYWVGFMLSSFNTRRYLGGLALDYLNDPAAPQAFAELAAQTPVDSWVILAQQR